MPTYSSDTHSDLINFHKIFQIFTKSNYLILTYNLLTLKLCKELSVRVVLCAEDLVS